MGDAIDGYSEDTFTSDDVDKYAVFVKPGGTSKAGDFESWDWKQIKAALWGGSALSSEALWQEAWHRVNPNTMYTAANVFEYINNTLHAVAGNLRAQAESVAGEHGSWTGPAAQAFL